MLVVGTILQHCNVQRDLHLVNRLEGENPRSDRTIQSRSDLETAHSNLKSAVQKLKLALIFRSPGSEEGFVHLGSIVLHSRSKE